MVYWYLRQQDGTDGIKKSQEAWCWEGNRADKRCQTQKWRLWGRERQAPHWGTRYPGENLKALRPRKKGRRPLGLVARHRTLRVAVMTTVLGHAMGLGLLKLPGLSLWPSPGSVPGKWQFPGPCKIVGPRGITQRGYILGHRWVLTVEDSL